MTMFPSDTNRPCLKSDQMYKSNKNDVPSWYKEEVPEIAGLKKCIHI